MLSKLYIHKASKRSRSSSKRNNTVKIFPTSPFPFHLKTSTVWLFRIKSFSARYLSHCCYCYSCFYIIRPFLYTPYLLQLYHRHPNRDHHRDGIRKDEEPYLNFKVPQSYIHLIIHRDYRYLFPEVLCTCLFINVMIADK